MFAFKIFLLTVSYLVTLTLGQDSSGGGSAAAICSEAVTRYREQEITRHEQLMSVVKELQESLSQIKSDFTERAVQQNTAIGDLQKSLTQIQSDFTEHTEQQNNAVGDLKGSLSQIQSDFTERNEQQNNAIGDVQKSLGQLKSDFTERTGHQSNAIRDLKNSMNELRIFLPQNMKSTLKEAHSNITQEITSTMTMQQSALQNAIKDMESTLERSHSNNTQDIIDHMTTQHSDLQTANEAPVCKSPSKSIEGFGCITPVRDTMSWYSAKANCERTGTRLFEGFGKEHFTLLRDLFPFFKGHGMWIGVRDWQWVTTNDPVAEELWYQGEPHRGNQYCAGLVLSSSTPGLFDAGCSGTRYSLCQLPY